MNNRISILVIEDHELTARGIQSALSERADLDVVGVASGSVEGFSLAEALKPDIILLDLHLPGGSNPRTLLDQFCADAHPWRVIVLSAEHREAFVEAVIEAGASGFLSKSEKSEFVVEAIKQVANGNVPIISKELLDNKPTKLSPGQKQLLSLLGQGLRYHEIAEVRFTTAETIRKQCDFLRVKLGLSNREQLISWAVQNGYASIDRNSLS